MAPMSHSKPRAQQPTRQVTGGSQWGDGFYGLR